MVSKYHGYCSRREELHDHNSLYFLLDGESKEHLWDYVTLAASGVQPSKELASFS